MNTQPATPLQLIEAFRRGQPVILTDHADRENEGDLVLAADWVSDHWINFMVRQCGGLICVALSPERAQALSLEPMARRNTDPHGTAFTISVDATSTGTGISVADRVATIARLAHPKATVHDFRQPGHIFPLIARPGGVLQRPGHTEAAVDLARWAGLMPAGVICEILAPDGTMLRGAALAQFAAEHGLLLGTVQSLIEFAQQPDLVERQVETVLPTRHGVFRAIAYRQINGDEHLALVLGDPTVGQPLVRLHSQCLTGDVLGSQRCDCGPQLDAALEAMAAEGQGVLVYLAQEGRGIGLINKLRAYALQDQGLDTVEANLRLGYPADQRRFGAAAGILHDLGVGRLRLLTNNPRKEQALRQAGLEVVQRIPLRAGHNLHNREYLRTKQARLGHLDLLEAVQ